MNETTAILVLVGLIAAGCAAFAVFLLMRSALEKAKAVAAEAEKNAAGAAALAGARESEIDRIQLNAESDLLRQKAQSDEFVTELRERSRTLQESLDSAMQEIGLLQQQAAVDAKTQEMAQKQLQDLQESHKKMLDQAEASFKALSETILKERSQEFQESGLLGIRTVTDELVRSIQNFQKRVNEVNEADVQRVSRLDQSIQDLLKQTGGISEQANHLATAIRGQAQVTGQWGEIQLKRVLEVAGLRETIDYSYQETFSSPGSDYKNLRTDVLVKLPGDRWLVIDAKTTLAAYADYVAAEEDAREDPRRRIVESVRKHVDEIKTKAYRKSIADATGKDLHRMVLMYIPFEEVYLIAMKAEIAVSGQTRILRDYAWENDIVFVDASALIPVLQLIAEFWARESTNENAEAIRQAAENLVEKVRVFLESRDGFIALGRQLEAALQTYHASYQRLAEGPGNIVKRLRDFDRLGVPAASRLPTEAELSAKSATPEEKLPEKGDEA